MELENQLSAKDAALVAAEGKLRSSEENVAMVVAEKEKQASSLVILERANEDLKVQLRGFDRKLKDEGSKRQVAESRVALLESEDHRAQVVEEFLNSEAGQRKVYELASGFYDRGCAYALRCLHHLVPDKSLLCRIFKGTFDDPEFRSGCDFVPFTENELAEIAEGDEKEGRHWSPPAPVHPNLDELCLQLPREVDGVEAGGIDVAPVSFIASDEVEAAPSDAAASVEVPEEGEPEVGDRAIIIVDVPSEVAPPSAEAAPPSAEDAPTLVEDPPSV